MTVAAVVGLGALSCARSADEAIPNREVRLAIATVEIQPDDRRLVVTVEHGACDDLQPIEVEEDEATVSLAMTAHVRSVDCTGEGLQTTVNADLSRPLEDRAVKIDGPTRGEDPCVYRLGEPWCLTFGALESQAPIDVTVDGGSTSFTTGLSDGRRLDVTIPGSYGTVLQVENRGVPIGGTPTRWGHVIVHDIDNSWSTTPDRTRDPEGQPRADERRLGDETVIAQELGGWTIETHVFFEPPSSPDLRDGFVDSLDMELQPVGAPLLTSSLTDLTMGNVTWILDGRYSISYEFDSTCTTDLPGQFDRCDPGTGYLLVSGPSPGVGDTPPERSGPGYDRPSSATVAAIVDGTVIRTIPS